MYGSNSILFFTLKKLNQVNKPTCEQITQARTNTGLTQSQAADLVHVNLRSWQKWEYGERPINLAAWELFLIKSELLNKTIQ